MLQLIYNKVEKLFGAQSTFSHLVEELPPNERPCQVIIYSREIRFKSVQGSLIKSDFGKRMSIVIDDHCLHGPFEVIFNDVQRVFLTQDYVFDYMCFEIFIIKHCIEFLLSKDILTSEVTGLPDGELLDAKVVIVFDLRRQDVDSACLEPRVAPLEEVEPFTH